MDTNSSPAPASDRDSEGTQPSASGSEEALTPDRVRLALRRVKDPELNINIIDLGLVYDVVVDATDVRVDMSLTTPACPSGPEIVADVERQLKSLEGIGEATVNIVWSPPWTPERIEPRVRTFLGF